MNDQLGITERLQRDKKKVSYLKVAYIRSIFRKAGYFEDGKKSFFPSICQYSLELFTRFFVRTKYIRT